MWKPDLNVFLCHYNIEESFYMNVLNDDPLTSFTAVVKNIGNFSFRTSVFGSELQSLRGFYCEI